jgi:predicted acyl esterase
MEDIMHSKFAITAISTVFTLLAAFSYAAPTETVMVAMRDGIKLATDVYLPSGEGPWPAIVARTPYGKGGVEAWAMQANLRGYAFVSQDFRGRFDSEGVDYPVFLHGGWGEHQDGYDTVEWIAAQDWCNGKVGGVGLSALGIDLNMMAPSNPPHLVCQYVVVAFSSMYHQVVYQGGAFRKSLWMDWLSQNKFGPESLSLSREHPDYDDYWKQFNCESVADRVNVPILFLGGWYDIFNAGTVNSYVTINKNGGEGARGKCRLIMEAYGHGRSDELVFPDTGRPKSAEVGNWLDWFDIWMKNDGKGIDEIPNVQYFVLCDPDDPEKPGNVWRSAEDWPVPAQMRRAYFHADGTLRLQPPEEPEASLSYEYDPKNPVPTIGGANLTIKAGPRDQRPVEDRPDVLVFTSEELNNPIEITGPVKVKLWASSTAVDTDFTAKLCDVYPDGRSIIVADGIIRARHRNSLEKSEMMEPGKVYEFEIDLWNTSLVFSRGHRIRVAISSSNSPRFEPNPNTGKPSGMDDETKIATNTIYLDAGHPSHILAPVVSW